MSRSRELVLNELSTALTPAWREFVEFGLVCVSPLASLHSLMITLILKEPWNKLSSEQTAYLHGQVTKYFLNDFRNMQCSKHSSQFFEDPFSQDSFRYYHTVSQCKLAFQNTLLFFKMLWFKNGVMIFYRCEIVVCDTNVMSEILVEGVVLVSDYRSHLSLKPGFSCHF